MPIVIGGEFLERFVDHYAVIVFKPVAVGLAASHLAVPMLTGKRLRGVAPAVIGFAPVLLPPPILVLVVPFTEFFVHQYSPHLPQQ